MMTREKKSRSLLLKRVTLRIRLESTFEVSSNVSKLYLGSTWNVDTGWESGPCAYMDLWHERQRARNGARVELVKLC